MNDWSDEKPSVGDLISYRWSFEDNSQTLLLTQEDFDFIENGVKNGHTLYWEYI